MKSWNVTWQIQLIIYFLTSELTSLLPFFVDLMKAEEGYKELGRPNRIVYLDRTVGRLHHVRMRVAQEDHHLY